MNRSRRAKRTGKHNQVSEIQFVSCPKKYMTDDGDSKYLKTLAKKLDSALEKLHVLSKEICPQKPQACALYSEIRNSVIGVRNALKK